MKLILFFEKFHILETIFLKIWVNSKKTINEKKFHLFGLLFLTNQYCYLIILCL